MKATIAEALLLADKLDAKDVLARFRDEFVIADPESIYLDGNSLGRLPKATQSLLQTTVESTWGETLIGGWNAGWWELPERVGNKVARLIGAGEGEVIIADSTTVNLFKLLVGYLKTCEGPLTIVTDNTNFPTDCHIAQGATKLLSPVPQITRIDLSNPEPDAVPAALRDAFVHKPSVALLSHVAFRSGHRFNLKAINEAARAAGSIVIWDFSHSAGAVPIDVHSEGVELAVGCTYKYLNGGPGAPAFLYIDRRLQERMENPIPGWFGQNDPFAMRLDYEPVAGIRKYLSGSTPILSMQAIEPSIELMLDAGIDRLWDKSQSLISLFRKLAESDLIQFGFEVVTPEESHGSHVSISHEHAFPISQALIEQKVVPDFRAPNLIRFGFAPIYNTHREVVDMVQRLVAIMETQTWRAQLAQSEKVVT